MANHELKIPLARPPDDALIATMIGIDEARKAAQAKAAAKSRVNRGRRDGEEIEEGDDWQFWPLEFDDGRTVIAEIWARGLLTAYYRATPNPDPPREVSS